MALRKISISAFENNEKAKSLFCLNITKGRTRGQVIFSVPRAGTLGMESVIVPATFIPIELTQQANRDQLMASTDLRKALSKGLLELIDTDDAMKFMAEDPEAQGEYERIRNAEEFQRNIMVATPLDDIPELGMIDPAMQEYNNNQEKKQQEENANTINGINAAVVHLISLMRETKEDNDAIATVRSMGELEVVDYKYLYENAPQECKQFINWAREKYNKANLTKRK